MTACATKRMLPETVTVGNLFLPLPDTDFRDYLDEIEKLAKSAPEIITSIEKDLARQQNLWADRKGFTTQARRYGEEEIA